MRLKGAVDYLRRQQFDFIIQDQIFFPFSSFSLRVKQAH
jgi:hypothetical protein